MISDKELTTMQRLIVLLILIGLCIFAYIHYFRFWNPSRPEVPARLEALSHIPSSEGFRYFSGYYNDLSYNHPVIYAYGKGYKSKHRKMLRIVGPGIDKEFLIQDIEKALSVYTDFVKNSRGNLSRHRAPEKIKLASQISPAEGFRYISGYYNVHNNFPTIYLDGAGHEKVLRVVGPKVEQEFTIEKIKEAFSAYKNLLRKRRYFK